MPPQYKEGARVKFKLNGQWPAQGVVLARNKAKLESVVDDEVKVHAEQEDWLIRQDDGIEVWVHIDDIEGRV